MYFTNHANTEFIPIQCSNVVVDTGNLLNLIEKTTYTGKVLTASDSLSWLESGVYKIFDALPIGYPNGIDNYKYGLLIVTKVDDYVAYQLFAVDTMASGLKHKVGFCHTTDRGVILWI